MLWGATKLGLRASFVHDDACPWCRVARSNLCTREKQVPRTLTNCRIASHLPPLDEHGDAVFPFSCDLCQLSFTKPQWDAEDMSSELNSKLFTKVHSGHVWRRQSLSFNPANFIMCLLHMRLSFCNSLWRWLVMPSAQVKDDAVAEKVLRMLQKDGINLWRLKKIHSTSLEAVQNVAFTGAAAEKVMGHFSDYLEAVKCKQTDKG